LDTSGKALCAALLAACRQAEAGLPAGWTRSAVAAVRERLECEVPRIAVGGRLNAGKSTIVNALLGRKLAPTNGTECTKVVTWFRDAPIEETVLRLTDGREVHRHEESLEDAIAAVGCPPDEIAQAEVRLSNATLSGEFTVVDTPGLDSLSGLGNGLDARSLAALSQADVLLYVLPHPGQADSEAIAGLRRAARAASITSVSTIGVLSRVDQLGDGRGDGDPWPIAHRVAGRRGPGSVFSAVVPVAGLLAETAYGGVFTESDMPLLHRLRDFADANPGFETVALRRATYFREQPDLPLTETQRERLLGLLGVYGIRLALDELRGGVRGADALLKALGMSSGFRELRAELGRRLRVADSFRTRAAVGALDAVTRSATPAESAVLAGLDADLVAARAHPALRKLALDEPLQALMSSRWDAPPGAIGELSALVTGDTPAMQLGLSPAAGPDELRAVLRDRINAWRKIAHEDGRAAGGYARTVVKYLESLFVAIRPEGPG
jgi:50S ribosome-binding GTPase